MAFFLFDTKPLPELMSWKQTGTIGCTRYRAICKYRLRCMNQWCIIRNNFHWNRYATFSIDKINFKGRLQSGHHIFQASIWLFENVPRSFDTLGTKSSVNIVYKTMFSFKVSENIYILPIWESTVNNRILNKVKKNELKQPHHMDIIFLYLAKKRHIQTQARQDKAWQGMARRGQARPDEAKKVSPGFEKYCRMVAMLYKHILKFIHTIHIQTGCY